MTDSYDYDDSADFPALIEDFTRSYMRWVRGEQEEEPTALDFPEMTDEEIAAAQADARHRIAAAM